MCLCAHINVHRWMTNIWERTMHIQLANIQGPQLEAKCLQLSLVQGELIPRFMMPPSVREGSQTPAGTSDSFGFIPLSCPFPEVMCFPETHKATLSFCCKWAELVESQRNKAGQRQQTFPWTRQRGKQDGHTSTPSCHVGRR